MSLWTTPGLQDYGGVMSIVDDDYEVVMNHEEQYSIWVVGRDVPPGWTKVGFPRPQVCVPRSHRRGLDRHAATQRSTVLAEPMSAMRISDRLRPLGDHSAMPGSIAVGAVAARERLDVNVVLRRRADGPRYPSPNEIGRLEPAARVYLTSEEFEQRHGAHPDDVDIVSNYAKLHGLDVDNVDFARRTVRISGTASKLSVAFSVELQYYWLSGYLYRGHQSPLRVPADVHDVVVGIVGLDERPVAGRAPSQRHQYWDPNRVVAALQVAQTAPATPTTASDEPTRSVARERAFDSLGRLGIKTPPQVAELYDFPPDTDGSGQCIAIIELGGGYRHETLEQYFDFLGMPVPEVVDVEVAGGRNRPFVSEPVDGEVCLDIEVIGGAANGARLVCYFAPLTALGFLEAIHSAVHDREHRPSVISASWDLSEGFWMSSPDIVELMEEVLIEAALLGVTVVCSAGDYGTPTTFHQGRAWVDYPASSPYVLGCGGTTLQSNGASIAAEYTWNTSATLGQATGGGVSELFEVPPWQQDVDLPRSLNPGARPGRGVPDVAANSDPSTGYIIQVTGAGTRVICGTSSAAPLWAALIARLNQALGTRVGFLNPLLYERVTKYGACRDIVAGDNTFYQGYSGYSVAAFPGYRAAPGWDPVTGWGSPIGTRLLAMLRGSDPTSDD